MVVLMVAAAGLGIGHGYAEAAVKENLTVGPGMQYQNIKDVKSGLNQNINLLTTDLNNPFAKVEVGIPNPLNTLHTTTSMANRYSSEGHRVVGAINGSFFDFTSRGPMYLIAEDNKLINAGIISTGKDKYVNEPIAFGIRSDGTAQIDHYDLKLRLDSKYGNFPFTGQNRGRDTNDMILYTPDNEKGYTNTNGYGTEYIVETEGPIRLPVQFGDVLTGKIVAKRAYGDNNNTKIAPNQFVVSVNGSIWEQRIGGLAIGDTLTAGIDIDPQWKNAQYMLASGPLLVKDGRVNVSMDLNSKRARERAPRTAIGIDSTKKKVYFFTVDGRQKGTSEGMTMKELAEYLSGLGVDRAINLDGGGSTTFGLRPYGSNNVALKNKPSDKAQRYVSTILYAANTAPLGEPAMFSAKLGKTALAKGESTTVSIPYVLDGNYNTLPMDPSQVSVTVNGNIAEASGLKITAKQAGSGTVTVSYGSLQKTISLRVTDTVSGTNSGIRPEKAQLTVGGSQAFKLDARNSDGTPINVPAKDIKWSVTGGVGTIDANGVFKAAKNGAGTVTAQYGGTSVSATVKVGAGPVSVNGFENATQWTASAARATAYISDARPPSPVKEGRGSVKLTYDFSNGGGGTAAAYITAKTPIKPGGKPEKFGIWVYGNKQESWLRGKIKDGAGKTYTIDFTAENGLNWNGWRYAEAAVPAGAAAPISFEQVYVAQADSAKQGKGVLYFDKLQALYDNSYMEPMFSDVGSKYWAKKEIEYLVDREIIFGYTNGTFGPGEKLTRTHAAALLVRALKLDTAKVTNPGYKDVPASHPSYGLIAAVSNAGIMSGKGDGTFDPNGNLTRAQMAVILANAYKLTGKSAVEFKDVKPGFWAYEQIQALAANNVTTGREDGTFAPGESVTRAQYSSFLYRILSK